MTANMVDYDWEQIENVREIMCQADIQTVFVQDFLPKGQTLGSAAAPDSALPDFPDQFRHLFAHLKVNKALAWHIKHHPQGKGVPISDDVAFSDFKKYDWSRVQVRLLMSVAGTYTGFKDMSEYGICRLGKILAEEGWQPRKDEKVVAEYQVSS
jgi:tyrosyl-DNA phosphodiesterase-1